MFDSCGSCQPGRLYCSSACADAARKESVRKARDKYNDRGSEEGREAHRLEEAERRARERAKRVGDQRLRDCPGKLQMPASAACQAAEEATDAAQIPAGDQPSAVVLEACTDPVAMSRAAATEPTLTEWTLVAWPELLDAAQGRLGTEGGCPFCGRRGCIVRVVSLDEWRRRVRYGFG